MVLSDCKKGRTGNVDDDIVRTLQETLTSISKYLKETNL